MNYENNFVSLRTIKRQRKNSNLELNFVPNRISALRREKNRPENQLEPNINEIQRFIKRGV